MRFLEPGAVLLRLTEPPLLCDRWLRTDGKRGKYCVFRCLESWKTVTLGKDVVVDGCERRGWEIMKRSHPDTL